MNTERKIEINSQTAVLCTNESQVVNLVNYLGKKGCRWASGHDFTSQPMLESIKGSIQEYGEVFIMPKDGCYAVARNDDELADIATEYKVITYGDMFNPVTPSKRPDRQTRINKEDTINLRIALNTAKTIDEFLALV